MMAEVALALWISLCVYLFWYIAKASTYEPISLGDLAVLWRLHKRETGCNSSWIEDLLVKDGKVVGFRCGCGCEYLQKRLITQKAKKIVRPRKLSMPEQKGFTEKSCDIIFRNIREVEKI
ncbi:MAG: hypothetical protein QW667_05870 [Candidatus Bathyarchaeia archaeon]